jgi:hypothetical protein
MPAVPGSANLPAGWVRTVSQGVGGPAPSASTMGAPFSTSSVSSIGNTGAKNKLRLLAAARRPSQTVAPNGRPKRSPSAPPRCFCCYLQRNISHGLTSFGHSAGYRRLPSSSMKPEHCGNFYVAYTASSPCPRDLGPDRYRPRARHCHGRRSSWLAGSKSALG